MLITVLQQCCKADTTRTVFVASYTLCQHPSNRVLKISQGKQVRWEVKPVFDDVHSVISLPKITGIGHYC